MNKKYIIITAAALLTSACATMQGAASNNNVSSQDIEYGSPDTYKDNIEIAGRVYKLQVKPVAQPQPSVDYNQYSNDNIYKDYNFVPDITHQNQAVSYNAAYHPLYYYGDVIDSSAIKVSKLSIPSKAAATDVSSETHWEWY